MKGGDHEPGHRPFRNPGTAVLWRVNACTGATTVLCNVSSIDAAAPTSNVCNFPAGSINFGTSLYFVFADLLRAPADQRPLESAFARRASGRSQDGPQRARSSL